MTDSENNQPDRGDSEANDIDWLTLRYVCQEMTEAEESAFLERLEHDQPLCESLAKQALLVEAAKQSFAPAVAGVAPVERDIAPRWQALVTMCLATAAVLALVMPLLRGFQAPSSETAESDLALRWAESIELDEASAAEDDFSESELLALGEELNDATLDATEETAETVVSVPAWMLAAVSVQRSGAEEEIGFPVEAESMEN